jgi:hypothetical protein
MKIGSVDNMYEEIKGKLLRETEMRKQLQIESENRSRQTE